jgi:hypothetical protein
MMPLAKVKSTQAFGEAPGRAVQSPRQLEQLFVVLRALSRFTGGSLGCCFSLVIFALTVLAEPTRTLLGVGPFHNEKTLDQGFRAHTSIAQTDTLLVSIGFDRPWLGR